MNEGVGTLLGMTGIVAAQVLLLWRVRAVEREQHYQARLHHWLANVMTVIANKLDVELKPKPERLPP